MFNKNIKLVLAVVAILLAIWQFTDNYIGNGILLILLTGIFVFLYFKNEIILLAFLKLRKQDFEGTNTLFCLLYTSPSPRDQRGSRMPSSA